MRVLHCLVESEDHCASVVVVEDGQRPQLGGNTVRPRNLRVAERPQYSQYPGVVRALAGITEGRSQLSNEIILEKYFTWLETGRVLNTGQERSLEGK